MGEPEEKQLKSVRFTGKDYLLSSLSLTLGGKLAFHTGIEITNADCRYVCNDNYFILMPSETKRVTFEIDRSIQPFNEYVKLELIQSVGSNLQFTAKAWNAPAETVSITVAK